MRILVINRERSHAGLLGGALKRLGHSAVWCRPDEALGRVAGDSFDGAFVEADPAFVELPGKLRACSAELPVALAGEVTAPPDTVVGVLPRVWTVADVRRVLDDFEAEHRRFARGSVPAAEFDLDDAIGHGEDADDLELPEIPVRPQPDRMELSCRSWAKVERLCAQAEAGVFQIVVHGCRALRPERDLVVLLQLPDELVLSFPARLLERRREPDGRHTAVVELAELYPDALRSLIPS
jgi:hypothetical protein